MLVFVVLTWLGRLSVLLVVAATGPAALMCHAIPFAEPVARIWWKSLLSCLAVQILQAVTLHMAVATLLVPGANLPALGLPNDPTGLFNLLIACFLLWMVIRIPKWVTRNFGGATSRGAQHPRLDRPADRRAAGARRDRPEAAAASGCLGRKRRRRARPVSAHRRRISTSTPTHQHTSTCTFTRRAATPPGRPGPAPYQAGNVPSERPSAGRSTTTGPAEPARTAAGGRHTPRHRPRTLLTPEGNDHG